MMKMKIAIVIPVVFWGENSVVWIIRILYIFSRIVSLIIQFDQIPQK